MSTKPKSHSLQVALNHLHQKHRFQSLDNVVSEPGPVASAEETRKAAEFRHQVRETRLVISIPSTNRATILPETVREITKQDRLPDVLFLSLASLDDLGDLDPANLPFPVEVFVGERGATKQRNRVLEVVHRNDIILMIDDDFLMAPDYLRQTEKVFEDYPNVVLATGTVLADGIGGRGFTHDEGKETLAILGAKPWEDTVKRTYSGYGCNFAVRAAAVLEHNIRFDEELPLYSWLEDVDFSRRIASFGKLVKVGSMRGVHLGTKSGRTSGVKLGYSQIVNPIYLMKKGSMPWWHMMEMIARNSLANILRSIYPPNWIDYRGRLHGNILAVSDLLSGRATPKRILEIKPETP